MTESVETTTSSSSVVNVSQKVETVTNFNSSLTDFTTAKPSTRIPPATMSPSDFNKSRKREPRRIFGRGKTVMAVFKGLGLMILEVFS